MEKQEQHNYLMYLIRELEKAGDKKSLDDFITVAQDLLKVRYKLHRLFDYPISAADYDELITFAENLLGVNRFGSADDQHYDHILGRTNDATSVESAQSINEKLNNMMAYNDQIITDALVDQALVNMELVEHILNNYTPDQLTIDIVKQAAAGHMVDGVRVNVIDGMKVNKQTADYIEMRIKQIREDYWEPNAETIAALEEAMNEDPSNFKTFDEVKQELADYHYYWSSGQAAHFFYNYEFEPAWKCADIWHKEIYYWPYNEQYIVGQINPVEWYKTKGDEEEWGPIFGPFNTPEELDEWRTGFWKWWHRLSDENKVVYHNIPNVNNKWPMWNTNYIEMFRNYAATNEYDYYKIAADAQNDGYSKMNEADWEQYHKRMEYWRETGDKFYSGQEFTKEWKAKLVDMVEGILYLEREMKHRDNEFDGETLHHLEQELLDFLKKTI